MMRKTMLLLLLCAAQALPAENEVAKRLEATSDAFSEMMGAGDRGIPQDLMNKAQCAVIVPGLKKGAFIFGAKYGRGFISCRAKGGKSWTAPGAIRIEGGSFGLQIGGSETDVILLVMNESGAKKLLSSQFKLGGDASVAAGPVGRTTSAETDAFMRAEMLSWSRARGVFAGVSLEGSTIRQDVDMNKELYGKEWENKEIITNQPPVPGAAARLIKLLNKYSPHRVK